MTVQAGQTRCLAWSTLALCLFFVHIGSSVGQEIKCKTSWASNADVVVLAADKINDGYCDCLDTGIDEPETSACSGMFQWAGLFPATTDDAQRKFTPNTFQCSQQPDLQIPASRVRDGVCDCCDGADESAASGNDKDDAATGNGTAAIKVACPDKCAAIVAAAAAAKRELEQKYQVGSKKRAAAVQEYTAFVESTQAKLEESRLTVETKRKERDQRQTQVVAAMQNFVEQRVERIKTSALALIKSSDSLSVVSSLTVQECAALILHACQLAGEMVLPDGAVAAAKTCVPLRLAALDMGAVWQAGDPYIFRRLLTTASPMKTEALDQQITNIGKILRHNSQLDNEQEAIWQESDLNNGGNKSKRRRNKPARKQRPRDVDGEEEGDEDDDDDDEYDSQNDDDNDSENQQQQQVDGNANGEVSKREELVNQVLALPFSAARDSFLDRALAVLEAIDEAEKKIDSGNDGDENETASPELASDDASISNNIDPLALPMIRNTLGKKQDRIRKGLDYAVSAKVLLESVTKSTGANALETLQRLAIGTLNYGKLSSVQLYQILATVVPELSNVVEVVPETCPSPWADICPPQDLERSGIRIPPIALIKSVQDFCAKVATDASSAAVACAKTDSAADVVIPAEVPDGYYGYFDIQPREEKDVLNQAFVGLGFQAIGEEDTAATKLVEIESSVDEANTAVTDLEKEITDMEESVGDPDKYGPDGELHSLSDKCFEVKEGKYTYSVCLFGSANQNNPESGSTDLGSWSGASTDTVTDSRGVEYEQRIWKWEHGAQCWNGPQRSATGYVTCGAETRVLSADEPDTCRYVLQMESPLACDEDYRVRHGL